jgi:SAM-dependent methyltransferase
MTYFGITLKLLGIDFRFFRKSLRHVKSFIADARTIRKQISAEDDIQISNYYPCIFDKDEKGGVASGHYFHQDVLVARKIFEAKPNRHVDVGSRMDGFVAHVASFREIEVFDIRPVETTTKNIRFVQADFMDSKFPFANYTPSLSCLHALEHFGLGRYGDRIDKNGHLKGFGNLHACLGPGGILYFSVPIGPLRIEFNAHRVFSLRYLLEMFKGKFDAISFSFVDDAGNLKEDVALTGDVVDTNAGCRYGCGIFELKKT